MRCFLSVFFILFTIHSQAQNVSVTVECPRIVRVGEAFQMSVNINASSSVPKLPEMPVFSVLRGPDRSQSSQISVVNGKVTQSVNMSYNYVLQANQEGTHEIPPVEVTVDKKTHQSQPVRVQVVAGNASTQPSQQNTESGQTDNSQVKTDNRDIFLSVVPSRTKMYQGENLHVAVKLFSKLDIASLDNMKLPNFEGFFKQEVETPPLRGLEREMVNGEIYGAGVLRQYVLFTQKSGT
ncbi:MAG: BatD family protein, partial [Bacteroidales bacterium]|nr:BatD family protein [Bacteroidales bacterium]